MAKAEATEARKEAAGTRTQEEAVRAEAVEEARWLRHGTEEAKGHADKTKAKTKEDVRKIMQVLAEAGARVEASKAAFFSCIRSTRSSGSASSSGGSSSRNIASLLLGRGYLR